MTKHASSIEERIQAKSILYIPTGCILWVGAIQRGGYGVIRVKGKLYTVTRYLWEKQKGPILEGLHLLHRCDTPACINVEHLFLGTPKDNAQDKLSKGRPNGGGPTRVDMERRDAILADKAAGKSWAQICRKYSCSTATIHRCLKGVYSG